MTEATHATTSASPTARQVWSRSRGLLLALTVLLIAGVVIAAVQSNEQHGRLDPRSFDPSGSRAVAELLKDRGVDTRVVTTTDAAAEAASPDTTLLVASPDLLTEKQQTALYEATHNSGGRTLLLSPGPASVDRLAPGVTASMPGVDPALRPACSLPEATRAGDADTGGMRYTTTAEQATSCYPEGGEATLVHLPTGDGETVVLGGPRFLYNDLLDDRGNASLALQLLGSRPHLVWYLPSLGDAAATDGGDRSFFDLIPSGWLWGTLQLALAAALAALWRARRLGPLIPERLPVAIRASEAVEGRARLYRKGNARDRAASALRTAALTRLAPLVGVPPSHAHSPEEMLPALSAQLPDGARDLHSLLFGPPPGDDAALIALADQLDALEREVRTS
ncbi:DUF4350 domain-containing protein [Streptomyces sp. N35]|uniref:DUF4350 domain-containing protein n=1 Tax=Streptomyces sp. N35 TaxID=2795730 RepID=UPI0018F75950|nr:DUF4350 domain-containing protein [Streptomyces sp. N35]